MAKQVTNGDGGPFEGGAAEGTELAGVLGFELLRVLQVKIDYRDGLVDFVYEAKR